jgi:F-box/leucine-rich repeat protein 2/20
MSNWSESLEPFALFQDLHSQPSRLAGLLRVAESSSMLSAFLKAYLLEFTILDFHSASALFNSKALIALSRLKAEFLQEIILDDCTGLTERSLLEFVANSSSLTYLSLRNCGNCVSNQVLIAISMHCRNLRELHLRCSPITNVGLIPLVQNLTLLNSLSLSYCKNFSDEVIVEIACSLKSLTRLDLSDDDQLTDFALSALTSSQLPLADLSITYCKRFSEPVLKTLISFAHSLRVVNFSSCHQITDPTVLFIVSQLPLLQMVNLFCYRVTDECVDLLHQMFPNLIILGRNDES